MYMKSDINQIKNRCTQENNCKQTHKTEPAAKSIHNHALTKHVIVAAICP